MDAVEELKARRQELQSQVDALGAEIAALDIAIRSLGNRRSGRPVLSIIPGTAYKTHRDKITFVLRRANSTGLSVHEVVEEVKKTFGVDLGQTTASVVLGRIKNSGNAKLVKRQWIYTGH